MVEYRLRDGFRVKAPAAVVGGRIEALKRRHADAANSEGWVTPEEVVEDARSPDSPIHDCFTWDVAEAARKQNLAEARYLIRCYEVHVIASNLEPVVFSPGSVKVMTADHGRVFMSPPAAMTSDDYREQVLGDTRKLLNGVADRLRKLMLLTPAVLSALEGLMAALDAEAKSKAKKKAGQPAKDRNPPQPPGPAL
jgi:hypothetical protein